GGAGSTPSSDNTGGRATEVWSHSDDTLFKLDPVTKQVTVVGRFTGCSSVLDIALDANSNMFATTASDGGNRGGLWSIDRTTAACSLIAEGVYPNSLSFVPTGTVDANEEALVGYQDDTDESVR